ncbi:MAG TPA: tetratricopeptide repeat protein [Leptospiraceae bacterium]|nr:tetratricopeptide repeat protein [Leptospiraceae bacterium]HMW04743.1 tetratricopeptide repeat protein [Leptospiraceae bacterium]HMX34320.1 tetratricopeptide repeat protein [Leptospiraceae bacterium]HMY33083.1 tetratricopeptide repeat protein [Leptospiraceae bacterium]HMZ65551.1 tetratricopeptide repeat protein [Leptospiraceae bacterium]
MKKIFLFLFITLSLYPVSREDKIVYAFRDTGSGNYSKMVIIGETVSIDKASMMDGNNKIDRDLMQIGVDLRPDTLTVKVLYNPGIRVGQTLYLIEKNPDHISYKDGNIVGQVKVVSIFNTSFFGQQIRGEGYLRLIDNKVMTVAMPIESESLEDAILLKKQADYFIAKGDIASAITYYKKAIKMDKNYPEAHYFLGKIHSSGKYGVSSESDEQGSGEGYVSAGYEYKIAWNNRDKFLDKHEKFQFYLDYMKYLINRFEIESFKNTNLTTDLDTCLEISKEALKMSPSNFDALHSISYSYFLYYLRTRDTQVTVDSEEKMAAERINIRKKQSEYLEKAQDTLEKALKIRHQDHKIQALAILLYFEKLRELPNSESLSQVTERNQLRTKIEAHGKQYLIYKPKSDKKDKLEKRIKDILYTAKGF